MKDSELELIRKQEKEITFATIVKCMFNEQFDIHDLDISSRTFTHWKQEGLIPFIQVRKRVKLNVYEYFWIQILQDLRSLGYPIPLLRKVTERCFSQFEGGGGDAIYQLEDGSTFSFPRDRRFNANGELPLMRVKDLISYQNSGETPSQEAIDFFELSAEDMDLSLASNLLYHMVNQTVITGNDVKIRITKFGDALYDGQLQTATLPSILKERGVEDEALEPTIVISLRKYFYQLITSPKQIERVKKLEIFNEVEMEVIRAMRAGKAKELKILFNKKDGQKDIVTTYKGVAPMKDIEKTIELFRNKKHVLLQLKSDDGNTTVYEYSTRKRFED